MTIVYQQIKLFSCLFIASLMLISSCLTANVVVVPLPWQSDKIISELYHNYPGITTATMSNRLDKISQYFLNQPYLLGALGEGNNGQFDQSPLYRFDGFDCETFVDTVIALAIAHDIKTFKYYINAIRYKNGLVDFFTRNHFTNIDWNKNNQQNGFLQDITQSFRDKNQQSVAKIATTIINKANWYKHFNGDHIKLLLIAKQEKITRLRELKKRGARLLSVKSTITYLPLTILFNRHGRANQWLFAQVPQGAIIEIVRSNWDLRTQIGTFLDVSHLGFAFWQHGQLIFRQASLLENKVIDTSLIDYLKKALLNKTIKGINVQIVTIW